MKIEQATELVQLWRHELVEAEAALKDVQAQVTGLKRLIEGVELMFPDLAPSIWGERPAQGATTTTAELSDAVEEIVPKSNIKATEGVRKILADNPTTWFSGRDMMNAFERNGYVGTETAIRLALKRANDKGFAEMEQGENSQIFRLNSVAESSTLAGVSTS
jgi:hypothetical protein